jgi:hypothetical protein
MISEPAAKLLWDARQAAESIARITAGKTFADYQSDDILRWAVEQQHRRWRGFRCSASY